MAKRHTDNRFIVQAIPPLFRPTGEWPNKKLVRSVNLESCDYTITIDGEKIRCGNPVFVSKTVQTSTGIKIVRRCKSCYTALNRASKKKSNMALLAEQPPMEPFWWLDYEKPEKPTTLHENTPHTRMVDWRLS